LFSPSHYQQFQFLGAQLDEVKNILDRELQNQLEKLKTLVGSAYYRYHDNFRFVIQKLCFIVTFAHFLKEGSLLNRRKVAEVLKRKFDETIIAVIFVLGIDESDPPAGFGLDIEDYLFGVLQLASELSRFSVNAVIAGNNMLPFKVLFCKLPIVFTYFLRSRLTLDSVPLCISYL
uniref:Translin n=1 Tax=Gongylonema pulchrum TaxID=637853 RepID=A0A183D2M1_9BILA